MKPASTVAVSAWIKASTAPTDGGEIISFGDSYAMRMLNTGNVRFFFYVGNNTWLSLDTTGLTLLDNTFHHLVGQKTTTGLEIYVDGIKKATNTATGTISYTLGPSLNIGRHANGFATRYFNGTIDEARVYPTPLSASEISALYAAGAAVRTDTGTPGTIVQGPSLNLQRWVKATDPNFPGVTLVRVTDSSDGTECHHSYSYWHVFNVDNTKLLLSCDNQLYLYPFDPVTQTFVATQRQTLSISQTYINEWTDIIWSSVDPNVIFFHNRTNLYKYDIRFPGQTPTLLRNFGPGYVDAGGTNCMRQLSKADFQQGSTTVLADEIFAFDIRQTCSESADAIGYVVWKNDPGIPGGVVLKSLLNQPLDRWDEVRINKTGQYLFIAPEAESLGNWILNVSNGTTTSITDTDAQRSVGHFDVGKPGPPPGGADLIGASNRGGTGVGPGHMYHPFSNPTVPTTLHAYSWGSDYQIRRIAHTRSILPGNCSDYWSFPRAAINRDGRFIVWTSNMT
ncbi:MAG TPA: LamG domain-containing protein, partial [Nitrospira sp.]|nr:LamG domain-containing protein [Nitrospira sp.]